MEQGNYRKGRRKPVKNVFNPDRKTISKAVEDFIRKGGRITIVEYEEYDFNFIKPYRSPSAMSMEELPDAML